MKKVLFSGTCLLLMASNIAAFTVEQVNSTYASKEMQEYDDFSHQASNQGNQRSLAETTTTAANAYRPKNYGRKILKSLGIAAAAFLISGVAFFGALLISGLFLSASAAMIVLSSLIYASHPFISPLAIAVGAFGVSLFVVD
jgi:hypothetical protein